jgi:uncharacterized protein with gpF-like domain
MPSRRQISREHIAEQRRLEAEWRNKVFWALRRSKKPFFDMIERAGLPMANAIGPSVIDPLPIRRILERLYKSVASKEAAASYNAGLQVKKFGFGASAAWLQMIENWFSTFITNLTADINSTTWKYITDIINNGIQEGKSYPDIIRDLKATGQDKRRASLIARTETNKSLGWAKYQAAGKLPYPVTLVWVSATDKRTRGTKEKDKSDHRHMDGMKVDYGVPFIDPRSKSAMLYPGDTTQPEPYTAGPGDVCNCRCTLTTRRKRT